MLLIGALGHLAAHIGQANEAVLVPLDKSAGLQCCNGVGDARLGESHVSGNINWTHHAHFLLENKDSLQVIFSRRMEFHYIASLIPQVPETEYRRSKVFL